MSAVLDPAQTIREVRSMLERARASHYLSDFEASTRLLQAACDGLSSLLPASWLDRMPEWERSQLRVEMQLLAGEVSRSEALQNQANGLLAGWAQTFAAATGVEPAAGYNPAGFAEMIAPGSIGKHEWEA